MLYLVILKGLLIVKHPIFSLVVELHIVSHRSRKTVSHSTFDVIFMFIFSGMISIYCPGLETSMAP